MCNKIQGGRTSVPDLSVTTDKSSVTKGKKGSETTTSFQPTGMKEVQRKSELLLAKQEPKLKGRKGRPGLTGADRSLKGKLTTFFNRFKKTTLSNLRPTIELEVDGKKFECDSRILNMKIPHGTKLEDAKKEIQGKINAGAKLYQEVMYGKDEKKGPCKTKDMTDLAWYLQAKCEAKTGEHFRDGAMTLSDPKGRLHKFLDSHDKAYQRESSHLNRFQRQGHSHRGIDARGAKLSKMDDVLPYGLKTMLFGKIPKGPDSGSDENRLYCKLECYGCPSMNKLVMKIKKTPWDKDGPQGNFRRSLADLKQTLGHTFTFLFGNPKLPKAVQKLTEREDWKLTERKERIPEEVIRDYNSLKKKVEENITDNNLKDQLLGILNQNNPTDKCSGIHVMLKNVENAIELRHPLDESTQGSKFLRSSALGSLENDFTNFNIEILKKYNNPRLRFGNEVIFTNEDFPT